MFAESAANVATPATIGIVSFDTSEESTIIAILQQFVHNTGDGWTWLLEQLRSRHGGTIEALRVLGERTGEMHVALAHSSTAPSFVPERFTNTDLELWQARLVEEVERTFAGLRKINIESTQRLDELEASLKGRSTNLDPLLGILRIRIHGDYHLGQVLRTVEQNFSIIDFEGEPSRPMEQRRLKWPALRDVAGMIRSFDYAAETVSRESGGDPDLAQWRDDATAAFIDGYRATVGEPNGLFPAELEAFNFALSALIIEKALYEARYEMDNRPDWLPIPFQALRRLATYH
jgi:trehalose synthase-fused probable maltokinase